MLSETPYERLPPSAIDRMGMAPRHKNVLVRLVIRPLERTLTDDEANDLRDRIYATVHRGGRAEWTVERQEERPLPRPRP